MNRFMHFVFLVLAAEAFVESSKPYPATESQSLLQTQSRIAQLHGIGEEEDDKERDDAAGGMDSIFDLPLNELIQTEQNAVKFNATEEFDCADEVIIRLGMAESFFNEEYPECIKRKTDSWFQEGGWGHRLMAGSGSGGSGMTREQVDQKIVQQCLTAQGHGIALGPRLIRMTFHDAADFNNLMFANGSTAPAQMGAVDACLHTALLSAGRNQPDSEDDDIEEVAKGDPNHNRGLNNAVKWVLHMASESRLSRPDAQVLGAVVAIEAWLDGPEMGASYGRHRGSCSKPVCASENCWDALTPFFKAPVAEPVGTGMFCPMTNTIDPLRKLLGLSLDELVALQGSHSVGGVIVCSGLGNVASGPYCPKKCGTPPGNFFENGNLDGTSFDDTPGKLDNRYYQLLAEEEYDELPDCQFLWRSFPKLSNRGLQNAGDDSAGSGGSGKPNKDLRETCQKGAAYPAENQCEVEDCTEKCEQSAACQEAQNKDDDDVEAQKLAWESCNLCKMLCSGNHKSKLAMKTLIAVRTKCREDCKTSTECVKTEDFTWKKCNADCEEKKDKCLTDAGVADFKSGKCNKPCWKTRKAEIRACWQTYRKDKPALKTCRTAADAAKKTCLDACASQKATFKSCYDVRTACKQDVCQVTGDLQKTCRSCPHECNTKAKLEAEKIYDDSALKTKPVRWCKRMTPIFECLNASLKVGINGGCGECPESLCLKHPNTGQGRLTIVQNVERWTTFRGLHKRIMVLPSDWSYLGKPETKALFVKYAKDEDEWKRQYVSAFNKVSAKGWVGKLRACTAVECTAAGGSISCPVAHDVGYGNAQNKKATAKMNKRRQAVGLPPFVRPTELNFDASSCTPPVLGSSCLLVGGYGMRAKLQCGESTHYCMGAEAAKVVSRIKEEWTTGGKAVSCQADSTLLQDKASGGFFQGPSLIQTHIRESKTILHDVLETSSQEL